MKKRTRKKGNRINEKLLNPSQKAKLREKTKLGSVTNIKTKNYKKGKSITRKQIASNKSKLIQSLSLSLGST